MEPNVNFMSKEHETDEDKLNRLIRQAGDEARARKNKVLSLHYKKLKAVVAEGVARRQCSKLSEMAK